MGKIRNTAYLNYTHHLIYLLLTHTHTHMFTHAHMHARTQTQAHSQRLCLLYVSVVDVMKHLLFCRSAEVRCT